MILKFVQATQTTDVANMYVIPRLDSGEISVREKFFFNLIFPALFLVHYIFSMCIVSRSTILQHCQRCYICLKVAMYKYYCV